MGASREMTTVELLRKISEYLRENEERCAGDDGLSSDRRALLRCIRHDLTVAGVASGKPSELQLYLTAPPGAEVRQSQADRSNDLS